MNEEYRVTTRSVSTGCLRTIVLVLFVLLIPKPAAAQTPVTVTGTIYASNGQLASSGTVTFSIRPYSSSVLYFVAGTAIIAPQTGQCGINASGVLQNLALSGACTVWGNDVITPGNTTYTVQFAPNGVVSNTVNQVLITGSTYNLATPVFAPVVNVVPQYQTITSSPIQVNLVPAATDVFTVGQSGAEYANVYTKNITVSGSQSWIAPQTFQALVTFNAGITGTGNTGTLTAGTGILGTNNTWSAQTLTGGGTLGGTFSGNFTLSGSPTVTATMNTHSILPTTAATYILGDQPLPFLGMFIGGTANQATDLTSLASTLRLVEFPDAAGVVVLNAATQTLSAKTLTAPIISNGIFSLTPTCTSGTLGTLAVITDSTVNTWGTTIAGSGADTVIGWCNGTNYTVVGK